MNMSVTDTTFVHAGLEGNDPSGAVVPPIHLSTTFVHHEPGCPVGYDYGRSLNPTRELLEKALSEVESGVAAYAFASGCAALTAVLSLLRAGEHVLAGVDIYGGTYRLLDGIFAGKGIEVSHTDMSDLEAVRAGLKENTRLVLLESPGNPMLTIADISEIARLAHHNGAVLVVDNTFATPYLQRPLKLGADIVVHSLTKYLGGHSDVIGGAVVLVDEALAERLYFYQKAAGAVLSPFDSWLVLRGMRTLPVRMRAHCQNALAVARFLVEHPAVEQVRYPGLSSHPQHELARRQMGDRFGGMVSFALRGGETAARRFLKSLRLFALAASLGGVESLACQPITMTHSFLSPDRREALGLDGSWVRLSVGLEDVSDLLSDIEEALSGL
jgi:cystathionine beta-lyase/cystathionine gamma-synthase